MQNVFYYLRLILTEQILTLVIDSPTELIDRVLIDDDVDRDGYLTYSEFVKARRRDEYHQRKAYEASMTDAQRQQYEQFKQFQAMQVLEQYK